MISAFFVCKHKNRRILGIFLYFHDNVLFLRFLSIEFIYRLISKVNKSLSLKNLLTVKELQRWTTIRY